MTNPNRDPNPDSPPVDDDRGSIEQIDDPREPGPVVDDPAPGVDGPEPEEPGVEDVIEPTRR